MRMQALRIRFAKVSHLTLNGSSFVLVTFVIGSAAVQPSRLIVVDICLTRHTSLMSVNSACGSKRPKLFPQRSQHLSSLLSAHNSLFSDCKFDDFFQAVTFHEGRLGIRAIELSRDPGYLKSAFSSCILRTKLLFLILMMLL